MLSTEGDAAAKRFHPDGTPAEGQVAQSGLSSNCFLTHTHTYMYLRMYVGMSCIVLLCCYVTLCCVMSCAAHGGLLRSSGHPGPPFVLGL